MLLRLCLILAALVSAPAIAQDLPQRPMRIIVPFAAGGGTDVVARTVAEEASRLLRQPVVIENRTGAGAILGTEVAARAVPDGTTLLMGTLGHAVTQAMGERLPYDLLTDFRGVALVGEVPLVLLVNPRLPPRDLSTLIAQIRAEPGRWSYGSAGAGSAIHVAGALFVRMAGLEVTHVPYRGAAPALQDVMAGNIQFMFDSVSTTPPHVAAGTVRAIAVTGRRRSAILPDVPSMDEAGLLGYEASTWNAILAPAAVPTPMIVGLHRLFAQAVNAAAPRLAAMGMELGDLPPEALDTFIRREVERWTAMFPANR